MRCSAIRRRDLPARPAYPSAEGRLVFGPRLWTIRISDPALMLAALLEISVVGRGLCTAAPMERGGEAVDHRRGRKLWQCDCYSKAVRDPGPANLSLARAGWSTGWDGGVHADYCCFVRVNDPRSAALLDQGTDVKVQHQCWIWRADRDQAARGHRLSVEGRFDVAAILALARGLEAVR